jgi:hypothetical protein
MKSRLGLKTLAIVAMLAGSGRTFAQECTTPNYLDRELVELIHSHPGLSGDIWLDFAPPTASNDAQGGGPTVRLGSDKDSDRVLAPALDGSARSGTTASSL